MSNASPLGSAENSNQASVTHLDSWKEIAAYVKRDISTVQRWEKREGMPVHRHVHDKRGSVYAFSSELDAWAETRRLRLQREEERSGTEASVDLKDALIQWKASWSRRWLFSTGVVLIGLLAVGYAIARRHTAGPAQPKITSVAVLPLKNLSSDPGQEYLADGMTEALIGRLSVIRGLRVISRTSVMSFQDTHMSVPEIARQLHVDAIVEGSLMREGDRVRVNAQLIRGSSDEHLWSQAYDSQLKDALTLESDMAQAIAAKVEVTVTGQERVRLVAARQVSPEVYESYLKGEFGKDNTTGDIQQSIAYYEDAIRKDPSFAPAYVGLAEAYDGLGTVFMGGAPGETRQKTLSAARKALELDPDLVDAHVLIATVQQKQWQWADAETEYKRALELNPSSAMANLGLSDWFLCHGRTDEALAWSQRARELDPVGVSGVSNGWILFHAHRYDEAIHELRSIQATRPDNATALWFLGFALIANNQPEKAIPLLEKVVSLTDRGPGPIGVLIRAYAHAGRRPDALRLLAELKRRRQKNYIPAGAFVHAYLGLDDKEEAFVWLERAYEEHSNILQWIKVHPYFDPLRNDPRFADLVARVGLN